MAKVMIASAARRTVEVLDLLSPQPTVTLSKHPGEARPAHLWPILGAAFPHHPYGYGDLDLGEGLFGLFDATHHAAIRRAIDASFEQVLVLEGIETPRADQVQVRLGTPLIAGDRWWVFIERRTPYDEGRFVNEWYGALLDEAGFVDAVPLGDIAAWSGGAWRRERS